MRPAAGLPASGAEPNASASQERSAGDRSDINTI
jgi:hypothetical protein